MHHISASHNQPLKGNLSTTISACGVYWGYYNEAVDSATLCYSTVQPHVGMLYHKQWFSEARKGNSWAKVRKWGEKKLQHLSEPSVKPVGQKPRHHPRMSWYQKLTMMMMLWIDLTWVTPCQHSPIHYVNSPLNPYPLRGEESLKFKFWLITWLKVVKCAKHLCRCLGYIANSNEDSAPYFIYTVNVDSWTKCQLVNTTLMIAKRNLFQFMTSAPKWLEVSF